MDKVSFLKTDDNKIINVTCIRWVKKMNECLEICLKTNGCNSNIYDDSQKNGTHRICKINNLNDYNRVNKYFE